MAWTFFGDEGRRAFLAAMDCDKGMISRARGWALWKALITYDGNEKASAAAVEAQHTLDIILKEYADKC